MAGWLIHNNNKNSPGGELCGGGGFQTLILGFDPRWIGVAYDDEGSFSTVMFSLKTWQEDVTMAREHVWSERLEQTLGLTITYDRTAQSDKNWYKFKSNLINNRLNYK